LGGGAFSYFGTQNFSSSLVVKDSMVTGNYAGSNGGGLEIFGNIFFK
jgi:hypothetical protein